MADTASVLVLEPDRERMMKIQDLLDMAKIPASYASNTDIAESIIKKKGVSHLFVDAKRVERRMLNRIIMRVSQKNTGTISIRLFKEAPSSHIESQMEDLIKGVKDLIREVKVVALAECDSTPSLLEVMRDLGFSQEILARIIGTSARSIARWTKEDVVPSMAYRERLDKVMSVHNKLIRLIKKEAIPKYLRSYNEALGGRRPLDFLLTQEYDKVLADLSAMEEGVFT